MFKTQEVVARRNLLRKAPLSRTQDEEKEIFLESRTQALIKTYQRKILFAPHYSKVHSKNKKGEDKGTSGKADQPKMKDFKNPRQTLKSMQMRETNLAKKKQLQEG